jgi:starch synthase
MPDTAPLKVLHVAAEIAPYAKVGGLADVVSALTHEMATLGYESRALIPRYGCIAAQDDWVAAERPIQIHMGMNQTFAADVWHVPHGSGMIAFVDCPRFFGGPNIYWAGRDNSRRFALLSRACIDYCHQLGWIPDIIHCHDWHTALVPIYLNTTEAHSPLGKAATVLSIHNLQHQGHAPIELPLWANLPEEVAHSHALNDGAGVNCFRGGLYHATKLVTVSPTYAREIQTPTYGCGLESVLIERQVDLVGILNGIDTDVWQTEQNPHLPAHYSAYDLQGKSACKAALQQRMGIEVTAQKPLFVAIARLFEQKGLDLLADCMPRFLAENSGQFALLGSGDPHLEALFKQFAQQAPERVGCVIGYDAALSHLMEAGGDFFLMPSRFEPCGLNQLYSMAYGTVPIVRNTGGLADSVQPYNSQMDTGTGLRFDPPTPEGLYPCLQQAHQLFYDQPEALARMRQRGMLQDLGWAHSAQKYAAVYAAALHSRRG